MQLCDLPGLGAKRLQALQQAGIYQPADLLHVIPQFIDDDESNWTPGLAIQCLACVEKVQMQFIPRRGAMLTIHLKTRAGTALKARFFKAPYLKKHFLEQHWYRFDGSLDKKRGDTLVMPKYQRIDTSATHPAAENTPTAAPRSCYLHCPDGCSAEQIQKWMQTLLAEDSLRIEDPIAALDAESYTQILRSIHQAQDANSYESARAHVALREICSIFWQLKRIRQQRSHQTACALAMDDHKLNDAKALFPFSLSDAQEQALSDLRKALAQSTPALQLIQGDVGCGKSAVAFLAAWIALHNNASVVYLAPTQLLAQQQFDACTSLLPENAFSCVLVQAGEQAHIQVDPETACMYFGTHALIQESMAFTGVRLVIIDEQQKFGVNQRQLLIDKCRDADIHAHVCMLSATPIPRSLSHCLYGDMDLVTIAERPQQHATVRSSIIKQPALKQLFPLIQDAYERGEQVFVIAPYLEADHQSVYTARALYKELKKSIPPGDIALLYGSLEDQQQEIIYQQLKQQRCRVLVSTSVVEVGFNLPHASCMVICNSERFGLAQLHQMRGRLGRGTLPGDCYFATPAPKSHPRLQSLLNCNNGFEIAEADLAQRGGGDLLGLRQHGLAETYCCDFNRDQQLIDKAQQIVASWKQAPARQLFTQPEAT